MSFHDFFRRFTGLNSRYNEPFRNENGNPVNKFKNPPWGDEPDEDDEFDELYSDYRSSPNIPFGFNVFSGDPMEMHKYFERQMNEMMRSFGSLGLETFSFGPGLNELPDEGMNSDQYPRGNNGDVRDRYLKISPGKPRFDVSDSKTDSDIDDRVNSDGIGALFKKDEPEKSLIPSAPRNFSKSFTSRVIISNNGKVEERVKEWSSDGMEKECVRRTLGDQTHSITTSKDKSGQVEQEEQMINIQQDSLPEFDKMWSNNKLSSSRSFPHEPVLVNPNEGNPGILSSLFRLFS